MYKHQSLCMQVRREGNVQRETAATRPSRYLELQLERLLTSQSGAVRGYRAVLREAGILSTWQVKQEARAGQRIRVAGMVVVR